MSKNSEEVRFSGGDKLISLQKLYHEVMMQNELRDGKGAYKLSYAGGESGSSFGGNQMDIYANKDARQVLLNIIINAKDKVPDLALSNEEIDAIKEKLDPTDESQKESPDLKHLQGKPEQVFGAEETIKINKILASDYGIQEVNKAYVVDMQKKAEKIDRVIGKIEQPTAKEFYSTTEGKVLLFDYNNQFNITESGDKAKLVNFLNSGSTTIYTSKDTQEDIKFSDKYTADNHRQYTMGTKQANNTELTRQNSETRLTNVYAILAKNKDLEVNPQAPKEPKPTEASQTQQEPQAKAEIVKLEQELTKAELECKNATAEWNEWSAGVGKDIPKDNTERIDRDQKCQDTYKKVTSLKEKMKKLKAEEQKQQEEQAAAAETQKQKAAAEKKQAEDAKVQAEAAAKQTNETQKPEEDKKVADATKSSEDTAKQQEKATKQEQAKAMDDKKKQKQENVAKTEADKQAQVDKQTASEQEQDQQAQKQQETEVEKKAAEEQQNAQKAEADKKAAEEQQQREQQGAKAKQEQEAQQAEADKQAQAKAEQEKQQKIEANKKAAEEAAARQAEEAKAEQEETQKAKQEEEVQNAEADAAQQEQDKKAQEEKATQEQQDKEEQQKTQNAIKRDQLEREGAELSPHDKIPDPNPKSDAMRLSEIERDHSTQQCQEMIKKSQEQSEQSIKKTSDQVTALSNKVAETSIGQQGAATGSSIGNFGGTGIGIDKTEANTEGIANSRQGHIEFTPCATNPDAYGNNPANSGIDTGVSIIGADQGHTDVGTSGFT